MNKAELRKIYQSKRRTIPPSARAQASALAAKIFIQQACFQQSEIFAAYLCFRDEFDAQGLMEAIWQANKVCYVPILAAQNTLEFVRYEYGDALHLNQYSILEPRNITEKISADKLDLVIAPLIAFDSHGHRLGTGGGYYDRTFAFQREKVMKKPFLVGLGYDVQEAPELLTDALDVNLQAVLTETRFLHF